MEHPPDKVVVVVVVQKVVERRFRGLDRKAAALCYRRFIFLSPRDFASIRSSSSPSSLRINPCNLSRSPPHTRLHARIVSPIRAPEWIRAALVFSPREH